MLEENFWQDKSRSKNIIKEKKLYEDLINNFKIRESLEKGTALSAKIIQKIGARI